MANEMNRETFNQVVALAYGVVDNMVLINGAEPTDELRKALKTIISFAAENETGVEDFHTTLTDFSELFSDVASAVYDHEDWLEWMVQDEEQPEEAIQKQWVEDYLPFVVQTFEQDGKPDYSARTESFNNYTDALCREGTISKYRCRTIDHPSECGD